MFPQRKVVDWYNYVTALAFGHCHFPVVVIHWNTYERRQGHCSIGIGNILHDFEPFFHPKIERRIDKLIQILTMREPNAHDKDYCELRDSSTK